MFYLAFEASVLAAFGAMFCWGLGDFFIQKCSRKIGSLAALAWIGLIGAVGLLPFIAGELPLLYSPANLLVLLVLGGITFVAAVLDFEALRQGKLSVIEMIFELELPVTVALGVLFFGERLSPAQLLLIGVVFAGLVLVSMASFSASHFRQRIEKGALLGVAAAVAMAFVNFFTAQSSKQVSPLMAIWVPWLVIGFASLAYILAKESNLTKFWKSGLANKRDVLAMGVFDTLAWLFFALALSSAYLSVTTAISESYVAIAMALGFWVNKEKIASHQKIGAAAALLASFALGLLA